MDVGVSGIQMFAGLEGRALTGVREAQSGLAGCVCGDQSMELGIADGGAGEVGASLPSSFWNGNSKWPFDDIGDRPRGLFDSQLGSSVTGGR